jgi:hypothetical protein
MRTPAPKAAMSLQDLDLFFVASPETESPQIKVLPQAEHPKSPASTSKKATLDLTGADWLQ